MGVYMSLNFVGDETAAKDMREFIKYFCETQRYYISGDINDEEGVEERDMQWECMKGYLESFASVLDDFVDVWDKFADVLKKHKDIKVEVHSMYDATTSDDISKEHIDEIHEWCKGKTDEEIDEEGLIRFISYGTYQWDEDDKIVRFEESEDTLDILG